METWYSFHDHAMNNNDHAKKHGRHAVSIAVLLFQTVKLQRNKITF